MKTDTKRHLNSDKIIKTIAELHARILERFPNANLAQDMNKEVKDQR